MTHRVAVVIDLVLTGPYRALHTGHHLELGRVSNNPVRYVALVELTAAWQRAGLIDARRDEHQWQRNPNGMTNPAQRDLNNAAIEALNLPPPGQGNTGPTPTHHPDPKAASVALALLQELEKELKKPPPSSSSDPGDAATTAPNRTSTCWS